MSVENPTSSARPRKPAKPRPGFHLFVHAAGVWAKKSRGMMHSFGPWADPDAALAKCLEQKHALFTCSRPKTP